MQHSSRTYNALIRAFINIVLGVMVMFVSWWAAGLVALVLLFRYRAYEVVLWGIVIDMLYGAPIPILGGIPLLFTVGSLVTFLAVEYSKRFLVFYT